MLLLFLHSLDMFILVRFFPLLHLIILYGLLDFNLYVFMCHSYIISIYYYICSSLYLFPWFLFISRIVNA